MTRTSRGTRKYSIVVANAKLFGGTTQTSSSRPTKLAGENALGPPVALWTLGKVLNSRLRRAWRGAASRLPGWVRDGWGRCFGVIAAGWEGLGWPSRSPRRRLPKSVPFARHRLLRQASRREEA